MIQTICPSCGLKLSFEDAQGGQVKCSACGMVVAAPAAGLSPLVSASAAAVLPAPAADASAESAALAAAPAAVPAQAQWHYTLRGAVGGPMGRDDLLFLVRSYRLPPQVLVWRAGMAAWAPADTVAELGGSPEAAGVSPRLATLGSPTAIRGGWGPLPPSCSQCGLFYPTTEMIQYEQKWVCAECKRRFFQRVQEGASLPGASPMSLAMPARAVGLSPHTTAVVVGAISLVGSFVPVAGAALAGAALVVALVSLRRHGGSATGWTALGLSIGACVIGGLMTFAVLA